MVHVDRDDVCVRAWAHVLWYTWTPFWSWFSLCPGFSGLNLGCEACTASPATKLGNSAFPRDERKHRSNCCTLRDQKGVVGQSEHDAGSRQSKSEGQQAAVSERQIHFTQPLVLSSQDPLSWALFTMNWGPLVSLPFPLHMNWHNELLTYSHRVQRTSSSLEMQTWLADSPGLPSLGLRACVTTCSPR